MKKVTPPRPTSPPPSPVRPASVLLGHSWWLGLAIFAAAFAVYWPALNGAFLWDDDGHITRGDLRSLAGLGRIWLEPGATQQYYPVLHTAFWLEHFILGDVPAGYHVVNVLLHVTAACLFAAVLRRIAVPGAWLAALLFALHPVCVESVAWISEQKNTLSAVFYLLAALAYLRFDQTRRPMHYAIASSLFLLALGTKTVTATLPAALLVVFWWQRGRLEWRRDVAPLAAWFGLAVVAGVTTAWVEHALVGASHTNFDLGPVQRGLLAGRVIWFYFSKLAVPLDLVFVYPRWTIDAGAWWQYLFPVGVVLLGLAAWRCRSPRGAIAAGLIFIGTLFPALGFVNVYPFVFSFVADHFQYLASLGLFALAGAGLSAALVRWPGARTTAATVALLVVLGGLTWRQSENYRSPVALYEHTLARNPAAWMAHNNLANLLTAAGRAQEAIPHLEAAIKLRPNSAEAENNLGYALVGLNEPAAALPHLQRAQQIQGDYVYAHNNLGLALMTLGRLAEAEIPLRTALRLKPEYPQAHLNLGLVLAQQDKTAEALTHFAAAVRLQPHYPEAEFNWAIGLALSNRVAESLPHFTRALELAPRRPDIRNAFGRALELAGRRDDAIARYGEALQLAPEFAEAHFNLARALQEKGRTGEAAHHFAEARRLGWTN
jgi:tetratricopeptide (TPR) repeat protein